MLYLIKSGNYLKIGYAKNVDRRIEAYNTHNPNFELLDVTSGGVKEETMLHNLCKKWLYKNEWFYFNKGLLFIWLDYVKQKEPNMCAYDYSMIGGTRTEANWFYNVAEDWENGEKYIEPLTKIDLIKQVIADSKQYLR